MRAATDVLVIVSLLTVFRLAPGAAWAQDVVPEDAPEGAHPALGPGAAVELNARLDGSTPAQTAAPAPSRPASAPVAGPGVPQAPPNARTLLAPREAPRALAATNIPLMERDDPSAAPKSAPMSRRMRVGIGLLAPGVLLTGGGIAIVAATAGDAGGGRSDTIGPTFEVSPTAFGAGMMVAGAGLSIAGGLTIGFSSEVTGIPEPTKEQLEAKKSAELADAAARRRAREQRVARGDHGGQPSSTALVGTGAALGTGAVAFGGAAVAFASDSNTGPAVIFGVLGVATAGVSTGLLIWGGTRSDDPAPTSPRAGFVLKPGWAGVEGAF